MSRSAPPTQQEWVAVLLGNGSSLSFVSTNPAPLHLPSSTAAALAAAPGSVMTIDYNGVQMRVQSHAFGPLTVVTGLSTAEVHRTLRRLVLLEVLIGGLVVVLAALLTAWGVRRSLAGLRRVSDTAQEVAAELSPTGRGLDRRVPEADDATEVAQLASSMNTLLSAVEVQFAARLESENRLRQFLADASHELRTPLTSIRGYAELARMQRRAGSGSGNDGGAAAIDAEDNLSRIEAEGTRMSRLVEDLLMLARNDRPDGDGAAPASQLVDLAEIADEVVAGARAAFPQRRVELCVERALHVIGDPDQLVRALRNLVTNAAVHTAEDRPILVELRADRSEAVLRVIDGGPGLPPEEAAHVFERFWRADKARSRARGGTGLGLSIVASIVAAHGGSVRFDSSVENGSTVTVRLPRVDV
jgi:two-component system OmpR family sensor kinase